MSRLHLLLAASAGISLGTAGPVAAQPSSGGAVRFAGCWESAQGVPSRARICMAPEEGGLRLTTIPTEGATTESSLRFDGERVAVRTDECSGWESARLSADGERIVVKAEIGCGPNPPQVRETTFSITPSGLLLQATGTGLAIVASAQIRVFASVNSYADIAPAVRDAVLPHLIAAERARVAQRDHPVSARDLLELESLGVSAPLIDLMVAAAYPRSFVIEAGLGAASPVAAAREGNTREGSALGSQVDPGVMFMNGYPMMSMYDWQMLYNCARFSRFSCSSLPYFGFSGFGGGFWPGYGGYGYPGFGTTVGYVPVVVRPSAPRAPDGGRAVRGRGYTESGSTGGRSAEPRRSTTSINSGSGGSSSRGGSASSGGSSTGGSSTSTGGSSTGSSSSGGGAARTAKPRPPGA